MRLYGILAVIATSFTVFACANTSEILEVGGDAYSVSSNVGGYRSAASARQRAFETGAQKCVSLGKRFILLNETFVQNRVGVHTSLNVTFRCLQEDDPEYDHSSDVEIAIK